MKEMRDRMDELLQGFDGSKTCVFASKTEPRIGDDYFFEGTENISFFEEKAFGDDGSLKQPKELSINKVGHALHEKDSVFKKFALSEKISDGLNRRLIRDEDGVNFDHPSPSYDQKEFTSLEVKAGSLVIIDGDLIHQSFQNQSPKSRHALILHVVDTDGFVWAKDNWLKRQVDPEPLYVS